MPDYTPPTLAEATEKAITGLRNGGSIAVYSRRERWALEAIELLEQAGLVTTELIEIDEQSTILKAHPTKALHDLMKAPRP